MAWTPFDASTTDARSMASPLIQSHPCAPEEGLVPRANARIFQPCRASARAVSPPIPPVAPSTRAIRVDSDISSSMESITDRLYLPLIDSARQQKDSESHRAPTALACHGFPRSVRPTPDAGRDLAGTRTRSL